MDAAKLMADVVAKASADLEKVIVMLSQQLESFNRDLDKSLKNERHSVSERLELALKRNQDGLHREKESLLKALAEFKQTEIERLIVSGRSVRSELSARAESASRELAEKVAKNTLKAEESLSAPNTELKEKYEQAYRAMQSSSEDSRREIAELKTSLETSLTKKIKELETELEEKLWKHKQSLEERFKHQEVDIQSKFDLLLKEISHKQNSLISKLEQSSLDGRSEAERQSQEGIAKMMQPLDFLKSFAAEQESSFKEELSGLSEVLNGLYETRLNNLAAQSRTEILSAAEHAGECLSSTKAELQSCLREYQRDYAEKFEALQKKLERTIEEYARKQSTGALQGLKEERSREHIKALFRRIGHDMVENAARSARSMEADFQESIESFERRIESAKNQACESLERESRLMQKELARSMQEFEKLMDDFKDQAEKLERQGKEAANIMMTIRQANLDL